MQGACDEFLSCAGFAMDEYAGAGIGHQVDVGEHLAKRRAIADDFVVMSVFRDFLLEVGILLFQPGLEPLDFLQSAFQLLRPLGDALLEAQVSLHRFELQLAQLHVGTHPCQHFLVLKRLDDVIGAAGGKALDLVFQVAQCRHENDRGCLSAWDRLSGGGRFPAHPCPASSRRARSRSVAHSAPVPSRSHRYGRPIPGTLRGPADRAAI